MRQYNGRYFDISSFSHTVFKSCLLKEYLKSFVSKKCFNIRFPIQARVGETFIYFPPKKCFNIRYPIQARVGETFIYFVSKKCFNIRYPIQARVGETFIYFVSKKCFNIRYPIQARVGETFIYFRLTQESSKTRSAFANKRILRVHTMAAILTWLTRAFVDFCFTRIT